jgi:hypothetical protein
MLLFREATMVRTRIVEPELIPSRLPDDIIERRYTRELQNAGVEGTVLVSLDIDEAGAVTRAAVIPVQRMPRSIKAQALPDAQGAANVLTAPPPTSHPALIDIAEAAARAERFHPATQDGRPVPFAGYKISFGFRRGMLDRVM